MITFLDIGKYGRFGNQMFQIASTIGIAIKNNYKYGFPEWENQKWFKNPLSVCAVHNFNTFNINWGYHDIRCPDWSTLQGYMQSEKYFAHCADLIKYYFEMNPLLEPLKNTVGLHFRAYSIEGVDSVHPEMSGDYYLEALEHFPGLDPVIFTDNIARAKEIIGLDCEYISNSTIEDFYLLKNCDGVIMANSSFSWWAGWLNGRAVAPTIWFGGRKAGLNTSDLYAEKFIVI